MIVNFGSGKCPLCGDFGTHVEKKMFQCTKCLVAFDDFFITQYDDIDKINAKYWN